MDCIWVERRGKLRCANCGRRSDKLVIRNCRGRKKRRYKTAAEVYACVHRGDKQRVLTAENCGCADQTVYTCAIHGECTIGKFKPGTKDCPQICAKCGDRKEG